jgi:hypothetical protein
MRFVAVSTFEDAVGGKMLCFQYLCELCLRVNIVFRACVFRTDLFLLGLVP